MNTKTTLSYTFENMSPRIIVVSHETILCIKLTSFAPVLTCRSRDAGRPTDWLYQIFCTATRHRERGREHHVTAAARSSNTSNCPALLPWQLGRCHGNYPHRHWHLRLEVSSHIPSPVNKWTVHVFWTFQKHTLYRVNYQLITLSYLPNNWCPIM